MAMSWCTQACAPLGVSAENPCKCMAAPQNAPAQPPPAPSVATAAQMAACTRYDFSLRHKM